MPRPRKRRGGKRMARLIKAGGKKKGIHSEGNRYDRGGEKAEGGEEKKGMGTQKVRMTHKVLCTQVCARGAWGSEKKGEKTKGSHPRLLIITNSTEKGL